MITHLRVYWQRLRNKSDMPGRLQNIRELIVSIYEVKKVIYRVLQKGYGKVASFKMAWRRYCQVLEHIQKL